MHHYGGLPVPAAVLALILFCMYIGLYHGLFGLLLALIAGSGICRIKAAGFRSVDPARAGGGSLSLGRGGNCADADFAGSVGDAGILADRKFCAHADCDIDRRLRTVV